jgi:DNA gyrase subunit A
MDENEHIVGCKMIYDIIPEHHVVYIFENGKGVRLPMSVYDAKSRRKKISGAYSDVSPLAGVIYDDGSKPDFFIRSDNGRGMVINATKIDEKSTRKAAGVQVMKLPKKGVKIDFVTDRLSDLGKDVMKCKKTAIPSSGTILSHVKLNF